MEAALFGPRLRLSGASMAALARFHSAASTSESHRWTIAPGCIPIR
jgi:hypothetical protein